MGNLKLCSHLAPIFYGRPDFFYNVGCFLLFEHIAASRGKQGGNIRLFPEAFLNLAIRSLTVLR